MTTIPMYTVFPIEPPLSASQLAAYKTIRLTSLQMDPQAFASNYAREAAFAEDVWRERLDSRFKQTLVASMLNASHAGESGDAGDNELGETSGWVGMASIIGPSGLLPSTLAPFKEAGVGSNWEIYGLFAMWVHPAHRGKGVGTRLVKACLEWARKDVDVDLGCKNRESSEKVVVLLVYDDNAAGRALYSRTGFTDLEGVPARDGERWMLARVSRKSPGCQLDVDN